MITSEKNRQRIGVFSTTKKVGEIWQEDLKICFQYDAEWIRSGWAISKSLQLQHEPFTNQLAHNFFGNLLPEGDYRRRVEQLFRVSEDNDYSLLVEIGGDCAGALTIGTQTSSDEAYYEEATQEQLELIIKTEGVSGLKQTEALRLSLAGAQGKIPLRFVGDAFELPYKGAASTHIMKFNKLSGEYPKLVENEYLLNRLGHHLGLNVVNAKIVTIADQRVFLCERYDREISDDGWPERIHQEDFCQALGISYQTKYEREGGPSIKQSADFVRALSLTDLNAFVDWIIFNFFTSNADGHAKNLSILYSNFKKPSLAPFYDLVCTRAYSKLDRHYAMAIGGQFDPDLVTQKHLALLAVDLGVTELFLRRRFVAIAAKMDDALDRSLKDLNVHGVAEAEIQHITQALEKFYQKRKLIWS